jgi:hypothetical protein
MPAISIDLEVAGTRTGSGPIVSASNLKTVQRLSKAGTISFDMPCSDPKAADVVAKRVVRPHTLRNGAVVALPAGIVDSIAVRGRGADPPLLTIAGDDILSELANRRVLGLEISDGSGGPIDIADALDLIMALAPAGWTIDHATYTNSGATVYKKFGNETVLAALIWVASNVGEQFRLGAGKQIVWLYHDQPVSGLRATQTGDPVALAGNTAVLLIDSLEEVADTHTVITRIYPYGAGNEDARVTLEHATWTAPAGYTIDTANNFIKYDSADTANRIEDVVTINTIAEIGTSSTDQESASNQLAVAAYEELRRRIVAVKTYKLTVTKLDAEIKVGETINVSYRKTIDGYVAVNINADLVVLEVSLSYGASGVPSAALTVATVDRYPVTGAAGVVQSMAGNQQANSGTVQKAARALTAESVSSPSFTTGSIPFVTTGGIYTQDNADLFWDAANDRLGIGQNVPIAPIDAELDDATTATAPRLFVLRHNTSGTPAAGFGGEVQFLLEDSTTVDQLAARLRVAWATATHASRMGQLTLFATDATASREALRLESSGTAAMIGVLGAVAAVRQTGGAATAGAAYTATEQTMLQKVYDALRTFGFLT